MKITSTWLLTSAAQVLVTIAVGAFMLINAAVISSYVFDGYKNYSKMESANVIMTGRVHHFNSMEFVSNPNGVMRNCTAVTASNGRMVVREAGDWEGHIPPGEFCGQLMSAKNLTNWKDMAPTSNGTGILAKLFWSAGFFVVFIGGAFLVGTIPANVVGTLIPGLAPYVKVIALLLTLPVLLFWAVFVKSAWSYHPTYWKSPDGYVVTTEKVFITGDRKLYTAPETLFDWTSSNTMQERKVFNVE